MRFSLRYGRQKFRNLQADPSLDFINSMAKKYMGVDKHPYPSPETSAW